MRKSGHQADSTLTRLRNRRQVDPPHRAQLSLDSVGTFFRSAHRLEKAVELASGLLSTLSAAQVAPESLKVRMSLTPQ